MMLTTVQLIVCSSLLCALSVKAASPTAKPTQTAAPTAMPISVVDNTDSTPYALHQLVVVNAAGDATIRLKGYDTATANLLYTTTSSTTSGALHQLSQVYSTYGYDPKAGTSISNESATVTGSNNRVYYKRPSPDVASNEKWDSFTFKVNDGALDSYEGTVTIVPPSGALVGSDFLLGSDSWTISGNKKTVADATFEAYSRGSLLNHYIYATDDKINVQSSGDADSSLWFFEAPSKYLGNYGVSYGGSLKFTLGAFSGDFSRLNGDNLNLVEIECSECTGPVGKGITLVFPVANMKTTSFYGDPANFVVPLHEDAGWLKDPQNSLKSWTKPTKCDIIQVLSRLSALRILGDWTTWYESVALDDVVIANTKGQLPICAMSRPDASVCTC